MYSERLSRARAETSPTYIEKNLWVHNVLRHLYEQINNASSLKWDKKRPSKMTHRLFKHSIEFHGKNTSEKHKPAEISITAYNATRQQETVITYDVATQSLVIKDPEHSQQHTMSITPQKLSILRRKGFFNIDILIGLPPDKLKAFATLVLDKNSTHTEELKKLRKQAKFNNLPRFIQETIVIGIYMTKRLFTWPKSSK